MDIKLNIYLKTGSVQLLCSIFDMSEEDVWSHLKTFKVKRSKTWSATDINKFAEYIKSPKSFDLDVIAYDLKRPYNDIVDKALFLLNSPVGKSKIISRQPTKVGKREDLGDLYVRSGWEANVARYLNYLQSHGEIYKWEYEPDTYLFYKISRGTRSYTPDFKVWEKKESTPYYYEVKGYMDAKSKTKLTRMNKYYPEIEIRLIQKKEYKAIELGYKNLIPKWE